MVFSDWKRAKNFSHKWRHGKSADPPWPGDFEDLRFGYFSDPRSVCEL